MNTRHFRRFQRKLHRLFLTGVQSLVEEAEVLDRYFLRRRFHSKKDSGEAG